MGCLHRDVEQEGWRINGFNKAIVAIRSRGMSGFSGCGKNVCTQVRDSFLGFFFLFFFCWSRSLDLSDFFGSGAINHWNDRFETLCSLSRGCSNIGFRACVQVTLLTYTLSHLCNKYNVHRCKL